jgi:Protein of unknown function (DUF3137)
MTLGGDLNVRGKQLDLQSLEGAGFSHLYHESIAPILRAREADRQSALTRYFRTAFWTLPAALVLTALVTVVLQALGGIALIVGLVAGVSAFAWLQTGAVGQIDSTEASARNETLAAVAQAIGCSFQPSISEFEPCSRLGNFRLLPEWKEATLKDHFEGTHKGCDFAFCNVELAERPEPPAKRGAVTFKGHLIRIAFPKRFSGTTIVRRDAGFVGNWLEQQNLGTALQRADLGSTELDRAFEIYTTDQVEARYLVDLALVARLLEIEHRFEGRNLRGAFERGDLLIAVESGGPRRESEPAPPPHFFERLMIYESYHRAGVSVTEETAAEIEEAFARGDEQIEALKATSKSAPEADGDGLDTIVYARAVTSDVAEILRLIDSVVETTS